MCFAPSGKNLSILPRLRLLEDDRVTISGILYPSMDFLVRIYLKRKEERKKSVYKCLGRNIDVKSISFFYHSRNDK